MINILNLNNQLKIYNFFDMQTTNKNVQTFKGIMKTITDKIGQQNFAYILSFFGNLSWPLSFIYINQHNYHPAQSILYRGIALTIFYSAICMFFGFSFDFKSWNNLKYVNFRNFSMTVHQIVFACMQFIVPIGIVNTLNIAGTLFTFIVDYYMFGTTINKIQATGIFIGVVGLILTTNGQYFTTLFDPSYHYDSDFKNYITDNSAIKAIACVISAGCNFFWALALASQKKLKDVSPMHIAWHAGILTTILSSLVLPLFHLQQFSFDRMIKGILFHGFPVCFNMLAFVSSITLAKNLGIVSLFTFTSVLSSYLWSSFRYNQPLNLICSVGVILVIYGIAKAVLNKDSK